MATKPHASLRFGQNVALTLVNAAVAVVVAAVSDSLPRDLLVAGLVSGVVQGFLQRRAMSVLGQSLFEAPSALEIRNLMRSTTAGRVQLGVLWASAALYLVLSFRGLASAGPDVRGLVLAICSQMVIRETLTLPLLRRSPPSSPERA